MNDKPKPKSAIEFLRNSEHAKQYEGDLLANCLLELDSRLSQLEQKHSLANAEIPGLPDEFIGRVLESMAIRESARMEGAAGWEIAQPPEVKNEPIGVCACHGLCFCPDVPYSYKDRPFLANAANQTSEPEQNKSFAEPKVDLSYAIEVLHKDMVSIFGGHKNQHNKQLLAAIAILQRANKGK